MPEHSSRQGTGRVGSSAEDLGGSLQGHSWAHALQTTGPPSPPLNPALPVLPGWDRRPLPICCRSSYPVLGFSIATNIIIFETSCVLCTVKISQLAQQRERGGWANISGFQFCLPKKQRRPFMSAHWSKLYQYIEMSIFRLKLWCFLNTRTAQSSSIFIKCPLHAFRAHFNETTTSISCIFLLVQPVWL